MGYTVRIILDKRRKKKSGLYPLKLCVYDLGSNGKAKRKYFKLPYIEILGSNQGEMSIKDFEASYLSTKSAGKMGKLRKELLEIEMTANEIISDLGYFSETELERKLLNNYADNVGEVFTLKMNDLLKNDQISTHDGYRNAKDCLFRFVSEEMRIRPTELTFRQINVEFLADYERWMKSQVLKTKTGQLRSKYSSNTIGIYIRNLRTIYNLGISKGLVSKDSYPFGRDAHKFTIPSSINVKKALNREQIERLFHSEPINDLEQRALDFWFISYSLSGINMRDLAELKHDDLTPEGISFKRRKIERTTKHKQKTIVTSLPDLVKPMIDRQKSEYKDPSDYLFPIYFKGITERQKKNCRSTILKSIGDNLSRISKRIELVDSLSFASARHSFTTIALTEGVSLNELMDALGHSSITTTMNYVASLSVERKKEIADSVTSFLR